MGRPRLVSEEIVASSLSLFLVIIMIHLKTQHRLRILGLVCALRINMSFSRVCKKFNMGKHDTGDENMDIKLLCPVLSQEKFCFKTQTDAGYSGFVRFTQICSCCQAFHSSNDPILFSLFTLSERSSYSLPNTF